MLAFLHFTTHIFLPSNWISEFNSPRSASPSTITPKTWMTRARENGKSEKNARVFRRNALLVEELLRETRRRRRKKANSVQSDYHFVEFIFILSPACTNDIKSRLLMVFQSEPTIEQPHSQHFYERARAEKESKTIVVRWRSKIKKNTEPNMKNTHFLERENEAWDVRK